MGMSTLVSWRPGLVVGVVAAATLALTGGCSGDRIVAPTRPALPLSDCTVGGFQARCGTLQVPENRQTGTGRQIGLHVVGLPATGTPVAEDPVFYLEGGPGGAATDSIGMVAETFSTVRAHRDLVFVDQRGTGESHPISCPARPSARPRGITDARYAELVVRDCLRQLDADPRFYTTPYAMDDLDAVRAALGYDRINLYGGSYGATAAQVLLARHGDRVRVAVLGGASLVDVPMLQTWPRHAQEALDKVLARCAADAGCSSNDPHLSADLPALLRQLERHPVRASTSSGQQVGITAGSLAGTVQLMTKSSEPARYLPEALHAAAVLHDYTMLANYQVDLSDPPSTVQPVMPKIVMCLEPWARADPAATARDGRGSYLTATYVAGLAERVICRYLPRADVGPTSVSSTVPTLLVQGGSDPQDPPENVADARRHFPNSTTVVVPWAGHGWAWDSCLLRLVNDTIERGAVDPELTRCVPQAAPPPFDLSR
jgi:pimeloyl-ACP methyl ester carboxylesterase